MDIRLSTLSRGRTGQRLRSEQLVGAPEITIGRGQSNSIVLADPAVAQLHARLQLGAGFVLVATVFAGGSSAPSIPRNERRVLAAGSTLAIGPYTLSVNARIGAVWQITIERADAAATRASLTGNSGNATAAVPQPDASPLAFPLRVTRNLREVAWSKRGLAWIGLLATLAAFVLLPVLNATKPEVREFAKDWTVTPDMSWNVGPLAVGHSALEKNCRTCHKVPFQGVRNQECSECHKKIGGHGGAVIGASTSKSVGGSKVFNDSTCAGCHTDHRGPRGNVLRDEGLCSDCHGKVGDEIGKSRLAKVVDFKTHPVFRPLKLSADGSTLARVPISDKPVTEQASNLRFPHDTHLSVKGIRSPEGRTQLACPSCHEAQDRGTNFAPVTMAKHCASCHSLEFEPAVTSRQLPHAKPEEVVRTLNEFYSGIVLNNVATDVRPPSDLLRIVPGKVLAERERINALQAAQSRAAFIAKEAIEQRVCITCHEIDRHTSQNKSVTWTVAPIGIQHSWYPLARFSHGKHQTSACTECHGATVSKTANDLLIPNVDTCQKCHASAAGEVGKVTTTCASCHGFHQPSTPEVKPVVADMSRPVTGQGDNAPHVDALAKLAQFARAGVPGVSTVVAKAHP